MTRKPSSPEGSRSHQISVRLTPKEFAAAAEAARASRKPLSQWMRDKCLYSITMAVP